MRWFYTHRLLLAFELEDSQTSWATGILVVGAYSRVWDGPKAVVLHDISGAYTY